MAGKQILITGATQGIGLAGARALAQREARLAIVARTEERGQRAAQQIAASAEGASVDVLAADLTSQASVRQLAAEVLQRSTSSSTTRAPCMAPAG